MQHWLKLKSYSHSTPESCQRTDPLYIARRRCQISRHRRSTCRRSGRHSSYHRTSAVTAIIEPICQALSSSYCYREGIDPSSKVLPCDSTSCTGTPILLLLLLTPSSKFRRVDPSSQYRRYRGCRPLAEADARPRSHQSKHNWTMTMVMISKIILKTTASLPTFAKPQALQCSLPLQKTTPGGIGSDKGSSQYRLHRRKDASL
jgi:hypothetical protein